MTTDERDSYLASCAPQIRVMYEAMSNGETWSASELRNHGGFPRGDGLTRELRKLMEAGLIRYHGRDSSRPRSARVYKIVPLDQVEQAAADFKAPKRKRRRRQVRVEERVDPARMRQSGEYRTWYSVRKRVQTTIDLLVQVDNMAFWNAAPEDELEAVLKDLEVLIVWAETASESIALRFGDDALVEKIEKMRNHNGRTPAEIETFNRMADKLSRRLA
jgi:hypothetical protein